MKRPKKLVLWLILSTLVFTVILWLSQLAIYEGWYPVDSLTKHTIVFKYIGKAAALVTTILICWSFLLNSKFGWVNHLISTKQEIVTLNKNVTKWAFLLMFVDPVFLAVNRLPNIPLFIQFFGFRFTSGSYGLGHNLGIISLLLIVFITLALRQDWIDPLVKTIFRSFFGIIPFLLIVHIFFVKSDVSRYLPLTIWVYGWLSMGIIAYIYSIYIEVCTKNNPVV
jgi:hypothetical protein